MTYNRFWGIQGNCECTVAGMLDQLLALAWLICGCGFMLPIGLVKGLILFIPTTLECLVIFVSGCGIWFSLIFSTPVAIILTKYLGPNLKVLCLIMFLPVYLLSSMIILLITIVVYLGMMLCYPIAETFSGDNNMLTDGFVTSPKIYWHGIKYIPTAAREVYVVMLKWMRDSCDHPYEIHLIEIPISVFYGFGGSVIIGIWAICNSPIFDGKNVYKIYKLEFEQLKTYFLGIFRWNLLYPIMTVIMIIPAIILTLLIPVFILIWTVIAVIGAFLYGYHLTFTAYRLCYKDSSAVLPVDLPVVNDVDTTTVIANGGFWRTSHINVWNELKADLGRVTTLVWTTL